MRTTWVQQIDTIIHRPLTRGLIITLYYLSVCINIDTARAWVFAFKKMAFIFIEIWSIIVDFLADRQIFTLLSIVWWYCLFAIVIVCRCGRFGLATIIGSWLFFCCVYQLFYNQFCDLWYKYLSVLSICFFFLNVFQL